MRIANRLAETMLGLGLMLSGAAAWADGLDTVNAFYFGNSFTENTMVGLHPLLGKSAGKTWNYSVAGAPGVPSWFHMHRLSNDPESRQAKAFAGAKVDTMVVLVFGGEGLSFVTTRMWSSVQFDRPTDVGDVGACSYLIGRLLEKNPRARAFIYTAWPGIPEAADFRKRVKDEVAAGAKAKGLPREETLKLVKERKPTHEEMEPLRKGFDYAAQWLTEDRSNYEESKKRFGEYVHIPDLGVHLDITPERAAAVNDAIWSVVAGHPYTHVPQE